MGFGEAIGSAFRNYVNFSGRAPRSEYWFFVLFGALLGFVTGLLDVFITGTASSTGPFSVIAQLAIILPSIAVSVRRLHDLDRTGWWLLIAFTGIGAIVLIIWDCMKGTMGPNRYGPDPLGDLKQELSRHGSA